ILVLGPTIELSRLRSNVFAEVVDRIGVSWDEMFGRLQKYKEREGHCRGLPKHRENGFRLGIWVAVQRRNADKVTASRRQRAAAECTIRRPARACRAWVAYGEPSAPHVARYARPACR